jgi:hypothetical protein
MEIPLQIADESEYQLLLALALLASLLAAEYESTPNLDPAMRMNNDSVAA